MIDRLPAVVVSHDLNQSLTASLKDHLNMEGFHHGGSCRETIREQLGEAVLNEIVAAAKIRGMMK